MSKKNVLKPKHYSRCDKRLNVDRLINRDSPRVLYTSVLNVCECCADLLPHRLGVIQCWDHQIFSHVEDSLDRRHNASGAGSEHFKNLNRRKVGLS